MVKLIAGLCLLFCIFTVKTSADSEKDELLEAQASGHYGVPLTLGWNSPNYGHGWNAPVQAVAVVHKEIPLKAASFGWGVENIGHHHNNGWGWNQGGHAHSYQYFNQVNHKGWGWKPEPVIVEVPVGGWGWEAPKPVLINPVIDNGWGWQPQPAHPVIIEPSNGWGWPQSKPVIVQQPIHNNGWGWPQKQPVLIQPIQTNGWGAAVNNGWGWTGSGYGLGGFK